MTSIYYSAAWTECGCLINCWHEHETVVEAASCIPCAGGYVVAVENGAMRSLTAAEESEFQGAILSDSTDDPAVEPAPAAPRERVPPRGEGETLLEFVLRLLSAHGFSQHAEPIPGVQHGLINIDMIDSVLSRLSESETSDLVRMYAEDEHSLLEGCARHRVVAVLHRTAFWCGGAVRGACGPAFWRNQTRYRWYAAAAHAMLVGGSPGAEEEETADVDWYRERLQAIRGELLAKP